MKRVLVIDPNPETRDAYTSFISASGSEVLSTDNFTDALGIVDSTQIDLIMCSLFMSGMSGIKLAKYISKKSPRIPIVMVTSDREIDKWKRVCSEFPMFKKSTEEDDIKNQVGDYLDD